MTNGPGWAGEFPRDLLATAAFTLLASAVLLATTVTETPAAYVVGLPFLLLAPGYALVSALFPERKPTVGSGQVQGAGGRDGSGFTLSFELDGFVRLGLAIGLSIVTVSAVGVVLAWGGIGLRARPAIFAVSTFTLAILVVATWRRLQLPRRRRFGVASTSAFDRVRAEVFHPQTSVDVVLNVVVVCVLVFALASGAFVVSSDPGSGGSTEFSLLTETDDGALSADGYQANVTGGRPYVVGVENGEGQSVTYTVIVRAERFASANATTVQSSSERARYSNEVEPGATWYVEHAPQRRGTNGTRLVFMLYRGSVPDAPSKADADRTVHAWLGDSGPPGAEVTETARNRSTAAGSSRVTSR